MSLDYKKSGVDIDAGNALIDRIKPFVKATSRIGSNPELGGFGAIFDLKKCEYKDPVLVSATDGVGTKLKVAIDCNIHDSIGIDLVAMSVNDLVVQGAEPLFFLDYFACSKLDVKIASRVIKGIADGCKIAGCALVGGETAEMPGIYQPHDYDLAGFAVGAVERDEILPKSTKKGDILIGLASSGIHSNGYSLVRYILQQNSLNYQHKFNNKNIGEELLIPTKIYVKSCLEILKTKKIKALAHITGGGLIENIPRVVNGDCKINIDYNSWQLPEIFQFLQKTGKIDDHEMRRTFNCGIGMVIIVDKKDVIEIQKILTTLNEKHYIIGELA